MHVQFSTQQLLLLHAGQQRALRWEVWFGSAGTNNSGKLCPGFLALRSMLRALLSGTPLHWICVKCFWGACVGFCCWWLFQPQLAGGGCWHKWSCFGLL